VRNAARPSLLGTNERYRHHRTAGALLYGQIKNRIKKKRLCRQQSSPLAWYAWLLPCSKMEPTMTWIYTTPSGGNEYSWCCCSTTWCDFCCCLYFQFIVQSCSINRYSYFQHDDDSTLTNNPHGVAKCTESSNKHPREHLCRKLQCMQQSLVRMHHHHVPLSV